MITFDFEQLPTAVTNDQFSAIHTIIEGAGWDLDYDVIDNTDTPGIIWLWQFAHDKENGNPTRHWIEPDGIVSLSEEVTWDWKGIQHDN
jgi:hypothetical protein